jgi:uncharacterized phage-associated protein
MISIEDRISSSVHTMLFVLEKLGGKADFHKIFKIMYFANQKHLARYGSLFNEDQFIAMKNGPVPSMSYDILKALRGQGLHSSDKERFEGYFKLLDYFTVEAKTNSDLEELSESAIGCLMESISENEKIDYDGLTAKSHDAAWDNTNRDGDMSIEDIAKAGGANNEMVKYIYTTLENHNAVVL